MGNKRVNMTNYVMFKTILSRDVITRQGDELLQERGVSCEVTIIF